VIRTALEALRRKAGVSTAATLILLVMTMAASVLLVMPGIAPPFWQHPTRLWP
jgi:UPF0716 family protein affecting phage T7 exclusion